MSGMSGIKSGTRSNGSISTDIKTQYLRESHKSVNVNGYIHLVDRRHLVFHTTAYDHSIFGKT